MSCSLHRLCHLSLARRGEEVDSSETSPLNTCHISFSFLLLHNFHYLHFLDNWLLAPPATRTWMCTPYVAQDIDTVRHVQVYMSNFVLLTCCVRILSIFHTSCTLHPTTPGTSHLQPSPPLLPLPCSCITTLCNWNEQLEPLYEMPTLFFLKLLVFIDVLLLLLLLLLFLHHHRVQLANAVGTVAIRSEK